MRFHGVVVFLALLLGADSSVSVSDDAIVKMGEDVKLTCTYTAEGDSKEPTWYKGTKKIETGVEKVDGTPVKFVLTLSDVKAEDDGDYTCRAEGGSSTADNTVTVTVARISDNHEKDVISTIGIEAKLTCEFIGSPDNIKWKGPNGDDITDDTDNYEIESGKETILTVTKVTEESLGKYTCVAEWKSASITVTDEVTLKGRYINADEKVFTLPSESVTLTCDVREDKPDEVTWYNSKGEDVTTGNRFTAAGPSKEGDAWRATLTISDVKQEDAVSYTCTAKWTTPATEVDHVIQLGVTPNKVASDNAKKVTVNEGDMADLKCKFEGDKMDSVEWVNPDGKTVTGDQDRFKVVEIEKADNEWVGRLEIIKAEEDDEGVYTCKAHWEVGQTLEHKIDVEVNSAVKLGTGLVLILAFFWNL